MNEEGTDRRIRKTRRALRQSLITLLRSKKLRDITVKELCEHADINRGTFYTHYRDVYDLFEKIEEEIFAEMAAALQNYSLTEDMLELRRGLPCFLETFGYLVENYELCIVLLGNNRDQAFIDRLSAVGRDRCVSEWVKMYHMKSSREAEYFYTFTVSGCIGILQYWLSNGRKETAEELALLAEQFILRGIPMLKESVLH